MAQQHPLHQAHQHKHKTQNDFKHINLSSYMNIHILHVSIYVHEYICAHAMPIHSYTYMDTYIYVVINVHILIYTCIYKSIYGYIYTYIHRYIYISKTLYTTPCLQPMAPSSSWASGPGAGAETSAAGSSRP